MTPDGKHPRQSHSPARAGLQKRAAEYFNLLHKAYPDAHCELNHKNPLQLLIATILSAQCTDTRVNLVTPELFRRYPSAKDLAGAKQDELEKLIHSTGFYRNKATNIIACSKALVKQHQGQIPKTMEELTSLPGVGRKTANVVLGNAFGINIGVVVDTHVVRLSQLLGLTKNKQPEKIETDLMALFPTAQWTLLSHLLIWHGRRRCNARKPDCQNCELSHHCPSCTSHKGVL